MVKTSMDKDGHQWEAGLLGESSRAEEFYGKG